MRDAGNAVGAIISFMVRAALGTVVAIAVARAMGVSI